MSRRRRPYLIVRKAGPSTREQPESPDEAARRLFGKSRRQLIAEAAYYRASRRGFRPGDPDRDWLEAEAEVDAMIREADGGSGN